MPVLEKLRLVSWCHIKGITIPSGHVPINPDTFPVAGDAFKDHSAVSEINFFGGSYGLVDVSGLTRAEVEEQAKCDDGIRRIKFEMICFLQCLDWIQSGNYEHRFPFTHIIAFLTNGNVVVAKPTETGFASVPYLGDDVPFGNGTLLLCLPDSL